MLLFLCITTLTGAIKLHEKMILKFSLVSITFMFYETFEIKKIIHLSIELGNGGSFS